MLMLKLWITTEGMSRPRMDYPAFIPVSFWPRYWKTWGMSQAEFARAIDVSPMRVSHVIQGSRPVTAELALLFGRAFDQTPQYWLNLCRPTTTLNCR